MSMAQGPCLGPSDAIIDYRCLTILYFRPNGWEMVWDGQNDERDCGVKIFNAAPEDEGPWTFYTSSADNAPVSIDVIVNGWCHFSFCLLIIENTYFCPAFSSPTREPVLQRARQLRRGCRRRGARDL